MLQEKISNNENTLTNFNLRRYFLIFSTLTVLVLTVLLSMLFVFRQKNLMENQSVTMVKTIAHQLNHEILQGVTFRVDRDGRYFNIDRSSTTYEELDNKISGVIDKYKNIFKVKIFDRRGITIYSTDRDNVGIINK